MSAKKYPIRMIHSTERYIVYMERQPRQRRMSFFFILFLEIYVESTGYSVAVFCRPQNGTFLVLTTGVVTYTTIYYYSTKEYVFVKKLMFTERVQLYG